MDTRRRAFIKKMVWYPIGIHTLGSLAACSERFNLTSRHIPASFFSEREDTVVTWLGMAGVLINARGTILFIDPLITMAQSQGELLCEGHYRLKVPLPIEFNDVPKVDVVMYTHGDADHFGRLTAQMFADRSTARFLATPPVLRQLEDLGVRENRLITAEDFLSVSIDSVVVEVTPALHDWQEDNPWQRGDCCGYVVRTDDGSIWHPGDTRLIDELEDVKDIDVLFFDIAAVESHLGPAGSARIARTSGAKVLVAYHYGTFDLPPGSFGNCDPRDALPFVDGLSVVFLTLDPGEPLQLPL